MMSSVFDHRMLGMAKRRNNDPVAAILAFSPEAFHWSNSGVYSDAGSTLAVNNDTVRQWNDLTGNGHHIVQATSGLRPLFVTGAKNGMPAVRFDGVDNFMQLTYSLPQPHTRFVVFKNYGAAGTVMVDGFSPGTGFLYFSGATTLTSFAGAGLDLTSVNLTNWHIARQTFDGASSKISLDGGAAVTGAAGAGDAAGLTLGAAGNGTAPTQVDILAAIEFASALSDGDVASIMAILNSAFAIY